MSRIKRILITGAAGFLGSHLCERLVAEKSTICLGSSSDAVRPAGVF
jgi:nucleoside-diphosphate-sugar epimerase